MRKAGTAIIPAAMALKTLSRQRAIHAAVGSSFQSRCRLQISMWNSSIESRASFASLAVATSKTDENLIKVLDSEIQCAVESDPPNEDVVTPDTIPFTIEDKPGEHSVILRRKYGNEDIKVEVLGIGMVDQEGEDDDDDDEEGKGSQQPQLNFNVTISKGDGPCLEFNCSAYPDEIVIDMMSTKQPKGNDDVLAYEGPAFTDLDENLQKSFHKYLEIRGVKGSLSNFLLEYMINKDSREYIRWLKNVKQFVEM
ncbi:hypothetical protein SUGI_1185310 [Cryptomeria japonica]|nr:hypothetical protein SUGI_1185310 [Cryptomeria japonica]